MELKQRKLTLHLLVEPIGRPSLPKHYMPDVKGKSQTIGDFTDSQLLQIL